MVVFWVWFWFVFVWYSDGIIMCIYCWEQLLSGKGLASTWKRTRLSPPTSTCFHAMFPAATCWCSPCQLPDHRNFTGTVELDGTNGWVPEQGENKVFAAALKSSKAIWSVKLQWLHAWAWVSWLLFYLLPTKYFERKFWQIFEMIFWVFSSKARFLYLQTLSSFTTNPTLHQTPLHSRRRVLWITSGTNPHHSASFWGLGLCQGLGHSSGTLCAWLSHCLSALFLTPGASPATLTFSLLHWDGFLCSCWGPRSSLSSSLRPSSMALCSSPLGQHHLGRYRFNSGWSLNFPHAWGYSLLWFTFPQKRMQSAYSTVPGT